MTPGNRMNKEQSVINDATHSDNAFVYLCKHETGHAKNTAQIMIQNVNIDVNNQHELFMINNTFNYQQFNTFPSCQHVNMY